jgi:hypothetical protein
MPNEAKQSNLGEIAEVRFGYPFRGPVKDAADGEAAVVQIKNVDADLGIDWASLVRTKLEGRRKPDWLQQGDIVFTARGNRNAAASVGKVSVKAVSSPHLYVIRLVRHDAALPEFLAWLMNQPDAQRYFAQSAEGTNITSIRKQVLQDMPLRLPSLEKQKLIMRVDAAARLERQLLERLIENRRQQLTLVAKSLMD